MLQRSQDARTEYPELDWDRFCGFMDIDTAQFTAVQDRLLADQMDLLQNCALSEKLLVGSRIRSTEEFREKVPLTTYEDYADVLKPGSDRLLPVPPHVWAYTTHGAGKPKWIPYSFEGFGHFLDSVMAALLIAAAEETGHVNVRAGDFVMYNVPPRPFLCGLAAFGMKERFGLTGVLHPTVAEKLEFKDRISISFKEALNNRVDLIISMTSVLLKTGERFEGGGSDSDGGRGRTAINHRALGRIARAKMRSLLTREPVRPRDLWRPKGIVGWGLDTSFSRDRIADYWGSQPYEMFASTEGGVMGVQPVDGTGMLFNPYADFFELIPENKLDADGEDAVSGLQTVLPSEAESGGVYEVVITNFHGMPMVRYRTGQLIRISPDKAAASIHPARFEVIGRSDQRIDFAGFTRIDEKTVWEALTLAGTPFTDWAMTSERSADQQTLRLYGEPRANADLSGLTERIHNALRDVDPLYRDLERMLDVRPLRCTILPVGAFGRYYDQKRAAGAPLLSRRPARMNAEESVLEELMLAASESRLVIT